MRILQALSSLTSDQLYVTTHPLPKKGDALALFLSLYTDPLYGSRSY